MNSNLSWYEDEYLDNNETNFAKISHKKGAKHNKGSVIKCKQKERMREKERQIYNQDMYYE